MLSKTERAFLLGNVTVSGRYGRMLRWRIRNKVERMKADMEIAQNSHVDLSRRPKVKKEPVRPEGKTVLATSTSRAKPSLEYYEWPPRY